MQWGGCYKVACGDSRTFRMMRRCGESTLAAAKGAPRAFNSPIQGNAGISNGTNRAQQHRTSEEGSHIGGSTESLGGAIHKAPAVGTVPNAIRDFISHANAINVHDSSGRRMREFSGKSSIILGGKRLAVDRPSAGTLRDMRRQQQINKKLARAKIIRKEGDDEDEEWCDGTVDTIGEGGGFREDCDSGGRLNASPLNALADCIRMGDCESLDLFLNGEHHEAKAVADRKLSLLAQKMHTANKRDSIKQDGEGEENELESGKGTTGNVCSEGGWPTSAKDETNNKRLYFEQRRGEMMASIPSRTFSLESITSALHLLNPVVQEAYSLANNRDLSSSGHSSYRGGLGDEEEVPKEELMHTALERGVSDTLDRLLVASFSAALLVQGYFDASATGENVDGGVGKGLFLLQLQRVRRVAGGAFSTAPTQAESVVEGSISSDENSFLLPLDGEHVLWCSLCETIRFGHIPTPHALLKHLLPTTRSLSHNESAVYNCLLSRPEQSHTTVRQSHTTRESNVVASVLKAEFTSDWEVGSRLLGLALEGVLHSIGCACRAAGEERGQKSSTPNLFPTGSLLSLSQVQSAYMADTSSSGAFVDLLSCVDSFGQYLEARYRRTMLAIARGGVEVDNSVVLNDEERRKLIAGHPSDTFIKALLMPVYGSFLNVTLNNVLGSIVQLGLSSVRDVRDLATRGGLRSPTFLSQEEIPPSLPLSVALHLTQTTLSAFNELDEAMYSRVVELEHLLEAEEQRLIRFLERGEDGEASRRDALGYEDLESGLLAGLSSASRLTLEGDRKSASRFDISGGNNAHGVIDREKRGIDPLGLSREHAIARRIRLKEKTHVLSIILPFGTPQLSPATSEGLFKLIAARVKSSEAASVTSTSLEVTASQTGRGRIDTAHTVNEATSKRKAGAFMRKLFDLTMKSSRILTSIHRQPPTAIVVKKRKSLRSHRDSKTGVKKTVAFSIFQRAPVNYSLTFLASLKLKRSVGESQRQALDKNKFARLTSGIDPSTGMLADIESTVEKLLAPNVPVVGAAAEGEEGRGIVDPRKLSRGGGVDGGGHTGIPLKDAMAIVDRHRHNFRVRVYVPPTPEVLKSVVKCTPELFLGEKGQSDVARERFMGLGAQGTLRSLDPRAPRLLPVSIAQQEGGTPSGAQRVGSEGLPYTSASSPAVIRQDASEVFERLVSTAMSAYASPIKTSATERAAAALGPAVVAENRSKRPCLFDGYDPALEMPIVDEKHSQKHVLSADDLQFVDRNLLEKYVAAGNRALRPVVVGEWARNRK